MADETAGSTQIEKIPSVQSGISAVASANAPFIYFDAVPFFGHVNGIGMMTLTAQRQIGVLPEGGIAADSVITALIRGNIPALLALKSAIEGILLLAQPAPEGEPN